MSVILAVAVLVVVLVGYAVMRSKFSHPHRKVESTPFVPEK